MQIVKINKTLDIDLVKAIIKKIGATFCQVAKIKQENQPKPTITLGNQKWKGNTPIFNINPAPSRNKFLTENKGVAITFSQERLKSKLINLPNIRNLDPRA